MKIGTGTIYFERKLRFFKKVNQKKYPVPFSHNKMEKVGINNGEGRGTVPLYTINKHLVLFCYLKKMCTSDIG